MRFVPAGATWAERSAIFRANELEMNKPRLEASIDSRDILIRKLRAENRTLQNELDRRAELIRAALRLLQPLLDTDPKTG